MMFFSLFVIAGTAANWSQLSLLGDNSGLLGAKLVLKETKLGLLGTKSVQMVVKRQVLD